MNVLTFEIPGVIQPQERPRFSRRGKNVVTHDAPKSKDFKDFVKLVAWQNKPSELITGPIKLQADILSHATEEIPYRTQKSVNS